MVREWLRVYLCARNTIFPCVYDCMRINVYVQSVDQRNKKKKEYTPEYCELCATQYTSVFDRSSNSRFCCTLLITYRYTLYHNEVSFEKKNNNK